MKPELITIRDFCECYAVSRTTLHRLRHRREIQFVKIGRATRIRVSDAEAWFDGLTVNHPAR